MVTLMPRCPFLMIFESKLAGVGGMGWAPRTLESAELERKFKHARGSLKGDGGRGRSP